MALMGHGPLRPRPSPGTLEGMGRARTGPLGPNGRSWALLRAWAQALLRAWARGPFKASHGPLRAWALMGHNGSTRNSLSPGYLPYEKYRDQCT